MIEIDTWYRTVQMVVEQIDEQIAVGNDEGLTLAALSEHFGYSPYHMTRKFHELSGMPLRDYLRLRRLAFALVDLRDSGRSILDIAVQNGFSSHEAFTRAFKAAYGVTPSSYRRNPTPVVLRTRIHTFDRYILGRGDIGMIKSNKDIKVYYVRIPAHTFLCIKNYESDGYFDFWEKQDSVPGQDCDTICGLLDTIRGKLDGDDQTIGVFSGQVMGYLNEEDGRRPECYGVRLPADYAGPVPEPMRLYTVEEGGYIAFEHGPFDYESECADIGETVERLIASHTFEDGNAFDSTPGRVGYFYCSPDSFYKKILPIKRP